MAIRQLQAMIKRMLLAAAAAAAHRVFSLHDDAGARRNFLRVDVYRHFIACVRRSRYKAKQKYALMTSVVIIVVASAWLLLIGSVTRVHW